MPSPSARYAFSGWHSRGYLPHFESQHVVQHVTFHLADSLPAKALARLEQELRSVPAEQQDPARRKRIERWLDAGHGSCLLGKPVAAELVQDSLLHFAGQRYRLLAWVVMPNHVHTLFQPLQGWTLAQTVASWKSYTGRRLSALSGASGTAASPNRIWHREHWDRFIRDSWHFQYARRYIHNNPVKAGLVKRPEEWPWGSAAFEATVQG